MKRFKPLNLVLYIVALGFLLYHLSPLIGIYQVSKQEIKKAAKPSITKLSNSESCWEYSGDYTHLTLGNPLYDRLDETIVYHDPASDPVVGPNVLAKTSFSSDNNKLGPITGWQENENGRNNAVLSAVTDGVNGRVAAKIVITDYDTGDAKWVSNTLVVKPGEYYRLENAYRSNAPTKMVLDYTMNDGSHRYITLASIDSADGNWSLFRSSFIVPPGAKELQIGQALAHAGTLETNNYKLVRQSLPQLQRGLVTISQDDGWRSIYENGLPLFKKYGIHTTQYVVSGLLNSPAYMTPVMVQEFQDNGHEIGSHTLLHEDLVKVDPSVAIRTMAGSRAVLNEYYDLRVSNFAPPYGSFKGVSKKTATNCYESMRGTDTGFNAADYDRYNLKVFNIENNTKLEEIREAVRFAKQNKVWLIFVYHEVDASNNAASEYAASLADLEKQLQVITDEKVPVVTISEGLQETAHLPAAPKGSVVYK